MYTKENKNVSIVKNECLLKTTHCHLFPIMMACCETKVTIYLSTKLSVSCNLSPFVKKEFLIQNQTATAEPYNKTCKRTRVTCCHNQNMFN